MKDIKVSVIYVNYKTISLILDSIQSIKEKVQNVSYEIIVVDNSSGDNAEEILSSKDGGMYRSSILNLNDTYYVFYSEITKDNKRGVGMVYGTSIRNLNGIKFKNVEKFKEYVRKNG